METGKVDYVYKENKSLFLTNNAIFMYVWVIIYLMAKKMENSKNLLL